MGMTAEPGDKVRLKHADHAGERGIVETIEKGSFVVRVEGTGATLKVVPEDVTNLSLAARKAWQSLPTRRVGRPKGLKFCDRVSVTLRFDRDLWEEFQKKESLGLIEDRTATINQWIREKLAQL